MTEYFKQKVTFCPVCKKPHYSFTPNSLCLNCWKESRKHLTAEALQKDRYDDWVEMIETIPELESLRKLGKSIADFEPDNMIKNRLRWHYKAREKALGGQANG